MLQQAIENEIEEFTKQFCDVKDEQGHRIVTRNGYLPERDVQTGVGPLKIKKPRVGLIPSNPQKWPNQDILSIQKFYKRLYINQLKKSLIKQIF